MALEFKMCQTLLRTSCGWFISGVHGQG